MQNSIKISNDLFGERTFSGGVSTTTDKRLGATGSGESSGDGYLYIPGQGSGLTNKEAFDLIGKSIITLGRGSFIAGAGKSHGEINFNVICNGYYDQQTHLEDEPFNIKIQNEM